MSESAPQISTGEVEQFAYGNRRAQQLADEDARAAGDSAKELGVRRDHFTEAANMLWNPTSSQEGEEPSQEVKDKARILDDESMEAARQARLATKAKEKYENELKAEMWDGREHYQANKEAYEQAAIEDATAVGHTVSIRGQDYTPQPPVEAA